MSNKQLEILGSLICSTRDELRRARRFVSIAAGSIEKMDDLRRELLRSARSETNKSSNRSGRPRDESHRGRSRRRSKDNKRSRRSRSRSPRKMQKTDDDKNGHPTIRVIETPKSPPVRRDPMLFQTSNPVSPSTVIPPCPEIPNTSSTDEEWEHKDAFELLDEILLETGSEEPVPEETTLDDRINELVSNGLLTKIE